MLTDAFRVYEKTRKRRILFVLDDADVLLAPKDDRVIKWLEGLSSGSLCDVFLLFNSDLALDSFNSGISFRLTWHSPRLPRIQSRAVCRAPD